MKTKPLAILMTLGIIAALAMPSHSQSPEAMTPQEAYIRHFLKNYPQRMEKTLALLPVIDGIAPKRCDWTTNMGRKI